MRSLFLSLVLVFAAAFALGQKAVPGQTSQTALPAGVTISDASYPLPLDLKVKIRDHQNQWDELEIENQKMLVKIEQNKALQKAEQDEVLKIVSLFGQGLKIDFNVYGFDGKEIRLAKKSAK